MEIKEKILKFIKTNKKKIIIITGTLLFGFFSILIYYVNKLEFETPEIESNEIISLEIEPTIEEEKEVKKAPKVFVDIKGNVVNPGIYEMDADSRVYDVIKSAGGLAKKSNTEYINLSKKIFDEMVIIIYSEQEIKEFNESKNEKECICENTINDACIENDVNKEEPKLDLININTADVETLMLLNGIGKSKAEDIIKYRNEISKFNKIEDLMEVSGIGESVYSKIKDFITTE